MTDEAQKRRNRRIRLFIVWTVWFDILLAVWLFNVSRPGTGAQGCPAGCASAGERGPGPLRIVSLNVLHGIPTFPALADRLDLIAGEITRLDADIVCLQEVPWTWTLGSGAARLAQQTGLNYLYLRANGNRQALPFEEGEVILCRYPLKDASSIELTPRAGLFEHRVVLHAVAATPWGDLDVFVTHLTNGEAEVNRGQAAALKAFVEETRQGPAIVAGDFNAREDATQIQDLARAWIDAYRTRHPQERGFTCCVDDLRSSPAEPLEERIDYLFLVPAHGQELRVVSATRAFDQPFATAGGWLWASDHVGLWVEVE